MQRQVFSYAPDSGWSDPLPDWDSPNTLVVAFGAPEYVDDPAPFVELCDAFPQAIKTGCSSAGEIFKAEVRDHSIVVGIVRFDHTDLLSASAAVETIGDSFDAGEKLARKLAAPDLRGVFVLSDGLSVNGSQLVRGLASGLPPGVIITGGLAGDGPRFEHTWVFQGRELTGGIVNAVGFYGDAIHIGHGSKGGWDVFGPERLVTRSDGSVLYELDGRPALALYKEYLGDLADELPSSGLLFPLSLRATSDSSHRVVRTILAVDEAEQSLTFAGDVQQGHMAQLMQANFDRLVDGAEFAASLAATTGDGLAIAISCVGRRLVLGMRSDEETEVTSLMLTDSLPQIGFYSYGEISPLADGTCDLHNQTMTLTTLTEHRVNPLLRRQLRRLGLSEASLPSDPAEWARLIATVSASYDDADRVRYLQERALQVSSAEMQDLHERQRALSESALLRERDLMKTVLDSLDGAFFSIDATGTILLANHAAEKLFDRPGAALIGVNLFEHLCCEQTGAPNAFRRLLETGQSVRGHESTLERHDGVKIPVSANVEPSNADGQGAVVVLRDVSDTRRVAEALMQARAYLGTMITRAPIPFMVEDYTAVGVWLDELRAAGVTDLAAYLADHPDDLHAAIARIAVLDANPAAFEMLEVPAGVDLRGRLDPSTFTEETLRSVAEQLQAIWDDRDALVTEVKGQTMAGNPLIARFHWTAPRVKGKLDLSKVIVALTDITQIVQSEERMRELIQSKDQFLASVSHELRTPLTAVTAAASVLDAEWNSMLEADRKELIEMLSHESTEMAHIVEDLLVAARADLGSLTIIPKDIPLDIEVQNMVGRMAGRGNNVRIGSIEGVAHADPLRLRQIVRNLLTNAARYGGDDVWVTGSASNGTATLDVCDNGVGVPDGQWERIFEPYQRATSTPGLTDSMGMGLNVARHLARLMGGDVTYDHDGSASRFRVTLPGATKN